MTFAVTLGGDKDTISLMLGAICGAYLGVGAHNQEWLRRLENQNYIKELA